MERKEYIIKPVVKAKFSGISSLPKSRTTFTGAELDKNGNYKTGLTKEEEAKFEEELGFPKGHLNKKNDLFWGHLEIRLDNTKPTVFTIESALDEIKLRVLMSKSKIALSELDVAKNPMAMFYIEDKEEKAKMIEKQADLELEALDKFSDMSADERKNTLKLYGLRGLDSISEKQIKATLYEKVKSDFSKFLGFINDKNIKTRILIEDLLEKNMLQRKGNYYVYEGESLGNSLDAVVEFFNDPRHQSIKIAANQDLKSKTKGSTNKE